MRKITVAIPVCQTKHIAHNPYFPIDDIIKTDYMTGGFITGTFEMSWAMTLFLWGMVFFAGFVDSVAGGGGLISLPAYLFTGMPTYTALSCNKFSGACGTTFSALRFFRHGALDVRASVIAAVGSLMGAAAGSRMVFLFDERTLKTMLALVIPFAAVFIMFKRSYGEENRSHELSLRSAALLSFFIGLIIGAYDGMIGPGTGTFAIIAFTALMKYDLRTASGNAKVMNMASNYGAAFVFAAAGTIDYRIAAPAALFGIAGNYIGSGFAINRGAKFIRPMMIFVI